MTHKELLKRIRQYRKDGNLKIIVAEAVFFCLVIGYIFIIEKYLKPFAVSESFSDRFYLPAILMLPVLIITNILLIVGLVRASARKFGLLCPHCGRTACSLSVPKIDRSSIIETGRCEKCHQLLFDLTDEDVSPKPPKEVLSIPRKELIDRVSKYLRMRHRTIFVVLAAFLVPWIYYTLAHSYSGSIAESFRVYIWLLIIIVNLAIWISLVHDIWLRRKLKLNCPHCKGPVYTRKFARGVVATGRCDNCYEQLFEFDNAAEVTLLAQAVRNSREELMRQTKQCTKDFFSKVTVFLIAFALVMVPTLVLISRHDTDSQITIMLLTLPLLLMLVGPVIFIIWQYRKSCRKFGFICPHCNASCILEEKESFVTTGKCGRCGIQLIILDDEQDLTAPAQQPMPSTRQGLNKRIRKCTKDRVLKGILALVALSCLMWCIIYVLLQFEEPDSQLSLQVFSQVGCLIVMVLVAAIVLFFLRWQDKSLQKFGLICPHCRRSYGISGRFLGLKFSYAHTIMTGQCSRCGAQIYEFTDKQEAKTRPPADQKPQTVPSIMSHIVRWVALFAAWIGFAHFGISVSMWALMVVIFIITERVGIDWPMLLHALPAVLFFGTCLWAVLCAIKRSPRAILILVLTLALSIPVFLFETANHCYQDYPGQYFTWWWYKEPRRRSAGGYVAPVYKYGYIDKNGAIVIEPKFDRASRFSEGFAAVSIDGKWGYVDKTGNELCEPQFDSAERFREGMAKILLLNKYGFVNSEGRLVVIPQFDSAGHFFDGMAKVTIGNKYGYINKKGQIVVEPQFDRRAEPFSEGLACVRVGNKYGFIDKTGTFAVEPHFSYADSFSEGLAVVRIDKKDGYIDKTGQIVIGPQFDWAGRFHEAMARIEINEKWGYIDKTGRIVIKPQYAMARHFAGGLAAVRNLGIAEKWGFVDKKGRLVIQPQFHFASDFSEGLAYVNHLHGWGYRKQSKWESIDKNGVPVKNSTVDEIFRFSDRMASALTGEKYGYIDKTGKIIIDPQFDSASRFFEGLAIIGVEIPPSTIEHRE